MNNHNTYYKLSLPDFILGGDIPAYGISDLINFNDDAKFSPNLFRFLSSKNKGRYTNIFQDPETKYFYIGLRDKNGIWCGANLMRVFCVGNKAETFSYPTSLTKKWNDVTIWFYTKYFEVGKKIYDLPEWKQLIVTK